MRYSVVLPRVEPSDAEPARRALDSARELWAKGEQRAALELVRHAAESADAVGQRDRALALSRAVKALAKGIGSGSVRPPKLSEAPPEAPAVSSPRLKATMPQLAPAKPVRASSSGEALLGSLPSPNVVISSPPAPMPVQSSPPEAPEAAAVSMPPLVDSLEDTELVVTVAPSNWELTSPNALIGRRAQRVAVAPGRGPGGTLMVRPLAPGEVAPNGSIVAVMVALESDGLPLSRTG